MPWKRQPLLRLLALLLLTVAAGPLQALDPSLRLSQYDIDCYGIEQGLPHNSVQHLAQDPDGYVLAATLRGVVRFDGVRMRDLTPLGAAALPARAAERALISSDGALWVGMTESGLLRISTDGVREWNTSNGLDSDSITHIAEIEPGVIWVSTATSMYALDLADPRPRPLGPGFPPALRALARTADQTLWFGTQDGLYRRRSQQGLERMDATLGLVDSWVWALHVDPQGALWVGTRGGLIRYQNERATSFGPESGLSYPATRAILTDRDGQLWVTSAGGGLHRRRGERFESLDSLNGLSSDIAWTALEDRSGNLWIGTTGGLCRLRDSEFANFTRRDGMGSDFVWTVAFDGDDGIWAGSNGGGLNRIAAGQVESLGAPSPGRAAVVHSLLSEGPGRVLLGTRAGIFRYQNKHFERVDARWNQPTLALARDGDGRVIVGSDLGIGVLERGRVRLLPLPAGNARARVQYLSAAVDGGVFASGTLGLLHLKGEQLRSVPIALSQIRGVYEDPRGVLWIGGYGLYRYQSGRLTHYGSEQGFQDSFVHSVLPDERGYLWITTNVGVWRAPIADLDQHADGSTTHVAFERFAEEHGMRSSETNGGSPNIALSADRRLWVATMGGVSTVRVDQLSASPTKIAARVERITADALGQKPSQWDALGPDVGRLDIDYTALNLRAPEAAQFRHRLLPLDADWVSAGGARTASYRQLPPGHYRFEVQATLDPLNYSGAVAGVNFTVAPNWYQSKLFRGVLLVLGVGLAVGLPLARIRRLRAQEARLQQEVVLRTADLQEANRKLDVMARTDVLTGVANRREFGERLLQQIAAVVGSAQAWSLALIDVDHFKAYNDQYGHLAGDDCLRRIAQTLEGTLAPEGALVARYGGEEFAVLMPRHDLARALGALQATRLAVAALDLPHATSGVAPRVTVSAGVAAYTDGSDAKSLIDAADRALYSAKHLGRNRVEVAL